MSLRTFTVFQDASSDEALQPKVLRPNAMTTRSSMRNVASPSGATVLAELDKENYDPVTGERAILSTMTSKKRKTGVLAAKIQPPIETNPVKKDQDSQPEQKKRKASTSSKATTKTKPLKKDTKGSGSTKKGMKRAGSRRVSPMPRLNEEEELRKAPVTQEEIDSRCKDLTVKPLADVSEAYDELSVFGILPSSADALQAKPKARPVKASSVEPEIRDYFEPSQSLFSSTSTSTRLRAMSEDAPQSRTFSTPERKQIYAAFTFSSPSGSKGSSYGDVSPTEQLA